MREPTPKTIHLKDYTPPAFLVTHVGRIEVDGRDFLLETPLRADFALVQAFLCDYYGNLTYALTARNFNPVIAMPAATVIVDAEHVVPVGVIPPDSVVTPAALVDYLIAHE